ncbi:MAG: NAD(P)-dependent oxidoreductase, partial [Candidatus Thermoplasmatota archaeon]
ITIHTPKIKEMIGGEQIKKMKKGVLIVNCARGGIINELALYNAIIEGHVGGAAFDVFEKEPATSLPLFALENFIATPHIAGSTLEAKENVGDAITRLVMDALLFGVTKNMVNFPVEYTKTIRQALEVGEIAGKFFIQYLDKKPERIVFNYSGSFAIGDGISCAILKGMLENVVSDKVSYINAKILAEKYGWNWIERNEPGKETSEITVKCYLEGKERTLCCSMDKDEKALINRIDEYSLNFRPSNCNLVFKVFDKPGIVGRVGSILGEMNVNILDIKVGKGEEGKGLIAVNIDRGIDDKLLGKFLSYDAFIEVRQVFL